MIVDDCARKCMPLDISRQFRAEDILNRLSKLFVMYGTPEFIRGDNVQQFIAKAIGTWVRQVGRANLVYRAWKPLEEWERGKLLQSCAR